VPTAVIAFDFDPILHLGDGGVRWETIGIAGAILAGLVLAGLAARSAALRPDDLIFVALGVVPGAVAGGRLGYVLLHPDFFLADPGRILDPAVGSLELAVGVVGGACTGALVAALLDGKPGQWLQVAAVPMLLVIFLGKLAMVLGGSGQGQLSDQAWSTAYLGSGPWGSLAPGLPAHPSQAYESLATLIVLLVLLVLQLHPALRRRDGRAFLVGLAWWAAARGIVASTWRDPTVLGPLRAEQVIDVVVVAGSLVVLVGLARRGQSAASDDRAHVLTEPDDRRLADRSSVSSPD
jgi:prolipoprotein diacylglyceryltransferase